MKVFISYRRADLGGEAKSRRFVGKLYDALAAKWGKDTIFLDVDVIPTGVLFTDFIAQQVARADVMLEVIGPQWAEELRRRHEREDDFVRVEIESATAQRIPVIPVLANGAGMPAPAELVPETSSNPQPSEAILNMLYRNAHHLNEDSGFETGVARLIADLEENIIRMEMVWCPPGTFMMGTAPRTVVQKKGWFGRREEVVEENAAERQHRVTLTRGFWIGKYPVTQEQWMKVIGINPSTFAGCDHPVESVSWADAVAFCERLSAREGGVKYRLPTEAEWEYACRAGSTTVYCFGDDEAQLEDYAWNNYNSVGMSRPVGQKKPNAWGIHDMHGNVWEWCADGWQNDLGRRSTRDPPSSSSGGDRVIRGGGWNCGAGYCRSANRDREFPGHRERNLGFRVAADSIHSSPGGK